MIRRNGKAKTLDPTHASLADQSREVRIPPIGMT